MQGGGRKRRASGGAGSKAQQGLKKQKRSKSDAGALPAAKKRRSAPEMPKGAGTGQATPYNLRTRSSMPAAGTAATGLSNSQPSSAPTGGLPSSVRPRNPNLKASWNELPTEVLKVICQQLDAPAVLAARGVTVGMREACSGVPIQLRFTLPMQSSPWMPVQLEAWDRRINGVAGLLTSGKMRSSELQLRMEGAAAWKREESMPAALVHSTVQRLMPLLQPLRKLGSIAASPITHLDAELPLSIETLAVLSTALPGITSLRLDSLIPPPHNHVQILSEIRVFPDVKKLDLAVTSWDQVQHVATLTQLTELHVRYCMWNIPELSPLVTLQQLHTFSIEVLDDRARFQLDFLGPLVRGLPRLRHLRAAVILSRTVVSEGGPATFDFLAGCGLQTLRLDVRVPQDAARTVHAHFRNLHLAPLSCKVHLTIRADALTRETSFDSGASRTAHIVVPRLGMAQPSPPEPRERWGALNLAELGGHPADALSLLHLRGYHSALNTLPDLSAARLTRLQISNARLGPADFTALSACTSLEHLFVRFTFAPDTAPPAGALATLPGSRAAHGAGTGGTATNNGHGSGGGGNGNNGGCSFESAEDGFGCGMSSGGSAYVTGFKARVVAAGCHAMLTRSRRSSLLASGQLSTGGAAGAGSTGGRPSAVGTGRATAALLPVVVADCTTNPVPYALQPLLQLRNLRSLELLEEGGAGSGASGSAGVSTPMASGAGGAAGRGMAAAAVMRPSAAAAAGPERGHRQTRAAAKGASDAAGAAALHHTQHHPQPTQQRSLLFTSKSALTHFMQNLALAPQLTALSLSLLAEEASLPDCPCKISCFSGKSASKGAPKEQPLPSLLRLRGSESIAELLLRAARSSPSAGVSSLAGGGGRADGCGDNRRFRVELGSAVVESAGWYRPLAWPPLKD